MSLGWLHGYITNFFKNKEHKLIVTMSFVLASHSNCLETSQALVTQGHNSTKKQHNKAGRS